MDFSLTEEQQAVRDLASQILSPRAPDAVDAVYPPGDGIDRDALAELAAANLLGLCLSEDVGGSGLGSIELSLLLEEAGKALTRIPLGSMLAAARTIDANGGDAVRAATLPGVVDGTNVITAALTEPGEPDPAIVRCTATADGDGYSLSGTKDNVPAAARATSILVPAVDGDEVILALVAPDADGVTLTELSVSSEEPRSDVTLDGVRVGADAIVARGAVAHESLVAQARLGAVANAVGIADKMLSMTASYVSTREQFGVPIGTFQGIAIRVANALIDVEATRATLWQAAWRLDNGLDAAEEILVAKFWASEAAERVATSCVHLHGGIGVDTDYPLHHYYLASKVNELSLGSASFTIDRIGRILAERFDAAPVAAGTGA